MRRRLTQLTVAAFDLSNFLNVNQTLYATIMYDYAFSTNIDFATDLYNLFGFSEKISIFCAVRNYKLHVIYELLT